MLMKDAAKSARFAGKVVLVTGVGGGAGLATALRFALEGARVVTAARSREHAQGARATLEAHGAEMRAVQVDCATEAGAQRAVDETLAAFGRLDVLASTAGGYEGGAFADTDLAALERMLDVNLRSVFCATRAAVPAIEKQGCGAIVVTTAVYGAVVPGPGLLAYNTAKSASTGYVRSLAGELAERNIRVNAVLPGGITHRFDLDRDPAHGRALGTAPALPADIAAAVTFLASEDACWITGATLIVDGGFSVARKAT